LQLYLTFAGLNLKNYKSHSFRIGAATTAWAKGFSEEQIQQIGRWNSEAFKKYIRRSCNGGIVHEGEKGLDIGRFLSP
jgi:hypothetical protein